MVNCFVHTEFEVPVNQVQMSTMQCRWTHGCVALCQRSLPGTQQQQRGSGQRHGSELTRKTGRGHCMDYDSPTCSEAFCLGFSNCKRASSSLQEEQASPLHPELAGGTPPPGIRSGAQPHPVLYPVPYAWPLEPSSPAPLLGSPTLPTGPWLLHGGAQQLP